MTFDFDINLNIVGINHEIENRVKKAQKMLDARVLRDSNYYIPIDTHTLEASGIENTVLGTGRVIWRTPYARAQYYGTEFDHSLQRNPNARAKWFEAAKAQNLKQWEQLVNDIIKHN